MLSHNLGPEAIYVGSYYGRLPDMPQILFVGNNPNSQWHQLGSLQSFIETFGSQFPSEVTSGTFFERYIHGDATHRGLMNEETLKHKGGIRTVLHTLFPNDPAQDLDQTFALMNGIMCKGFGDEGKPHATLRTNCMVNQKWLRKAILILQPQIIFIFSVAESNSTWAEFTVENGQVTEEISTHNPTR